MFRAVVLAFCAFAFSATNAQQRYPSKPLRVIVPFAPGGSTDIFARLVAERLSASFAQPVVVENRAGASGNIGAEAVALAKKDPGKLTFASSGAGSSTHLSAELFKSMAGIDVVHIPFKGSGQALIDVVAGRVSMIFDNMPSALPHIRGGKLRALGVTGLKRSLALPDVPTISEAGTDVGLRGYDSLSWSGFVAPSGTPREIVQRINRETAAILVTPEMKQKLAEQGADAIGGAPEVFADHVRREREKWSRLVRERNIVVN